MAQRKQQWQVWSLLQRLVQWWKSLPRTEKLSITMGRVFPKKDTPTRSQEPTEIIIHESVARGRKATVNVLRRRGLSVEFTVDRDGSIHQHVKDVKKRRCQHAGGGHNKKSIGIEVCNRYYGSKAVDGEEVIEARWAHKGKYILPTLDQCEAVWQLILHLDVIFDSGLLQFPGVDDAGDFYWGRSKPATRDPGVKAHHRFHHADGLFIEFYCANRHAGATPQEALDYAKEVASGGKRWTTVGLWRGDDD